MRRDTGGHQGPEFQQRDVVGTPKRGALSTGIREVTKTTRLHQERHRDDTRRPGTSPGGTQGDTVSQGHNTKDTQGDSKTCGLTRRCGAQGEMWGHQNHRAPPGGTPRDTSGWTSGPEDPTRRDRRTKNAPPRGTGEIPGDPPGGTRDIQSPIRRDK